MAPKRTAAAKAKHKAKASLAASAPLKKEPASACSSILDGATPPAKKARHQLGRRDSEEQAERCMKQYFAHIPKAHLQTMRVDGILARENVLRAIREKKAVGDNMRLGASFWRDTVQRYSEGSDDVLALVVTDKLQPLNGQLTSALDVATSANPAHRNTESLVVFLQHCGGLNQREIVGMSKALHSKKHMGVLAKDICWIEMLKAIVRLKLQGTFATEVKAMRACFDAALSRNFNRLAKVGVSLVTWLEQNSSITSVLLDSDDLSAVLSCKGSWSNVAPQIARLTSSCQLGATLFAFAGQLVSSATFGDEVQTLVCAFVTRGFTDKSYQTLKEECDRKVEIYESSGVLSAKRVVKIEFFDNQLPLTIQSLSAEWEFRFWAAVKLAAIGYKGGLPKLPFEEWVLDDNSDIDCVVPDGFFTTMKAARSCALDMLANATVSCLEDMKKILTNNASQLVSIDRSFKLELEYLNSALDTDLVETVQKQILAKLPSTRSVVTMQQAADNLAVLRSSQIGEMCSRYCQAKIEAVRDLVTNMARGVPPDSKLCEDIGFFSTVLQRLACFQRATVHEKVGDGMKTVELVGKRALDAAFGTMRAKMKEDSSKVTLVELENFQSFKWLLNDTEKKELAEWVQDVLKKLVANQAVSKGRSSASSSSGLLGAVHTSAKKAKASSESQLLSYFG